MKKNLIVIQEGCKECGAACLLSIIRYYKGNCSINKILEYTSTSKEGTTFYNIKQAAQKLGLSASGFYINNTNEIYKLTTPILCQIITNNYEHFVVIYKIKKEKIYIMDPSKGQVILTKKEFESIKTGNIMIFEPYKKLLFLKDEKYLNKIIIDIILKNKSFVINILLLSIIFTIVSCIYAFYMQIIIDHILTTSYSNLKLITLIFSIILVIKCLSNYLRNKLLIIINQKIDCSLILNTFKKLLLLPYNYYKNKTTGDIISRINDLAYIKNILNQIILTVLLDLIIATAGGIILIKINKNMFLILIIIVLMYSFLQYIFRPILKKLTNINQENNSNINSKLVEFINGFETIKGLNIESIMYQKLEKIYSSTLNSNYKYQNIINLELLIKEIITLFGYLIINYIGFKYIKENTLTLGSLLLFNALLAYFIDPVRNVLDLTKEYYYAKNALRRANNLFEVEEENLDKESNLSVIGNIKINNLSFKYNHQTILKNLNINIQKNQKVLLIGASGSGKSTLLKILYKYYEVKRNIIYLNEYDINDLTTKDIRKNITFITQNEILYEDTIKNNILINRNIKEEEFQKVCKITYVDEIVKEMNLGYETKLEENGLNISGGQRQRIILARALLKNSKIFLIDEGLNEIDIKLEKQILNNIFSNYKETTFIIVSHRLENIDIYDQVINLEKLTYKSHIPQMEVKHV